MINNKQNASENNDIYVKHYKPPNWNDVCWAELSCVLGEPDLNHWGQTLKIFTFETNLCRKLWALSGFDAILHNLWVLFWRADVILVIHKAQTCSGRWCDRRENE